MVPLVVAMPVAVRFSVLDVKDLLDVDLLSL